MELRGWWDKWELWGEVEVDKERSVFVGCVGGADDEAAEEVEAGVVGADVYLVGGERGSENFVFVADSLEEGGGCWWLSGRGRLVLVCWWLDAEDLELGRR